MRTPELPEQALKVLDLTHELADRAETALASTVYLAAQISAAAETLAQADFFDDGSFGAELAELGKPGGTRHGKYTGEQLARNIELRDTVIAWHVQGVGVRRMVRELRGAGFRIGENSVLALLRAAPELVATEKKRVSGALGTLITLMHESIKERLLNGTMKPTSVDLAIIIDKKAAIDGEAGLVIEHRHTFDASPEAFAKKLEEMKRAKVLDLAVESQSTAIEEKPEQKGVLVQAEAHHEAHDRPGGGGPPPVPLPPDSMGCPRKIL